MLTKLRIDKRNYYLSNGLFCIVGYVVNKSISFFMIPIMTRMMSTAEYGLINTYVAWMAILAYFMGLALEYSVRTAYVDFKEEFESYFSSVCFLSVINLVLMGSVFFLLNKIIYRQWSDAICLCCILHAYVHAIINYFNIKFTMQEKYFKRIALLLFPNLISAVLGVWFVYYINDNKYLGRIFSYIIIFVPVGIILIFNQLKKVLCLYNDHFWRYGLNISLPMIFHGLSTVILSSSDRIIISNFRNASETGVYSLVYNLIMVVVAVFNALENIWLPWFTRKMQLKDYSFINKISVHYALLVAIVICVLLLISPEIIVFMATEEYYKGRYLLIPLICSSLLMFMYSLSIGVEIYYKETKKIAFNTMSVALFNLIADIIFIKEYGMVGAAYVTLLSYFLSFLGHYYCARKLSKELFPLINYIPIIVFVIIVSFIMYLCIDMTYIRWSLAIAISMTYICYGYVNYISGSKFRNLN